MKNRIEISKNSDGRVEEGTILFGARKLLRFSNDWDDQGFLRSIKFEGQKSNLPTATELYWLMGEKFIERIRKIDLIDLIDRIALIDSITNIGTLANLTTVGTVNAITNVANIQSVDLIDAITNIANIASLDLVDKITLIDAITTISNVTNIASLDLIDRITLIDGITNIANIASLDLIDRVTLIDAITNIANIASVDLIDEITNIANIGTIKNLDVGFVRLNAVQNPRFTSGFDGWRNMDTAKITIEDDESFGKHVKFNTATYYLYQYIFVDSSKNSKLCFWAYKPAVGGSNIRVFIIYADATTTLNDVALTNSWKQYTINTDADKIISSIGFRDVAGICYLVLPQLVESIIAESRQATRTNLLTKPEREDLLCKSFDLTVGTSSLLGVVAGQNHKVYGWDYEADTDGANEFQATINSTSTKFGRRITKGVHAMTLVHPIVCDATTALAFVSAGNTKLRIQYKTEA